MALLALYDARFSLSIRASLPQPDPNSTPAALRSSVRRRAVDRASERGGFRAALLIWGFALGVIDRELVWSHRATTGPL